MSGAFGLEQIVKNSIKLDAFVMEQFADIITIPGREV